MRDASEVIADAVMGGLLSKQVNRYELVVALRATLPAAEPADAGRDAVAWTCRAQIELLSQPKIKGALMWAARKKINGDVALYTQAAINDAYARGRADGWDARPPSEAAAVDVDWRWQYRFQTIMRFMDNGASREAAERAADADIRGLENAGAALASQQVVKP